jgi:hypothetical protein
LSAGRLSMNDTNDTDDTDDRGETIAWYLLGRPFASISLYVKILIASLWCFC